MRRWNEWSNKKEKKKGKIKNRRGRKDEKE